jgi:hypothetical protein
MMGGMGGGGGAGGGGGMPWMKMVTAGANSDKGNTVGGSNGAGGERGGGKSGGGMMESVMGRAKSDSSKATSGAMGLAMGAIQSIKAKKLKDKAEGAMPELVDPGQAAFLSELNQKRRSIDTGADFAAGMQAIDATNSGTNDALVRNSGGDASGTIQALLQSERVAGDSKNNVLAQGQQQQVQYNSMYGNLLNDMSQRRLELQLMRSQQARAEWAKMQSNASKNVQAGIAGFSGAGSPQIGQAGQGNSGATPAPNIGGGGKTGLSALDNPGLGFGEKKAAAPSMQQQTFGTVSDSPVIDKGVQQATFGDTSGKSLNADFLSNIRGGFKK